MDADEVRVLLIEDSTEDAELLVRELRRGGIPVTHHRVETEADLRAALLEGPWDVVISDYRMPGFDGLHAARIVRDTAPGVPFIFVSGVLGEERGFQAIESGAADYVLKTQLARLVPAVRRELREHEARRKAAQREQSLRGAVERARSLSHAIVETVRHPLMLLDRELRVLTVNPAFERVFGLRRDELVGRPAPELSGDGWSLAPLEPLLARVLPEGAEVQSHEVRLEGGERTVVVDACRLEGDASDSHVLVALDDVTRERRVQRQIIASQRLEAIGRLAGGIAHDFNNLLTVIGGYCAVLMDTLEPGSRPREDVATIQDAANRAAALTSQLLTFSRQSVHRRELVDLNVQVGQLERMLRRVISEQIELSTTLGDGVGLVQADPSHLDQILMNLVLNARDAMPNRGRLRIHTTHVDVHDPNVVPGDTIQPGRYACVRVTDDGIGMDEATRLRVFEPFFTTKPTGKGTGLGLATVYGLLRQMGGFVTVESELGRGSVFAVFLPSASTAGGRDARAPAPLEVRGGAETVLLVEDNELVRRTVSRILRCAGYTVLEAADGEEAIAIAERSVADRGGEAPGEEPPEAAERIAMSASHAGPIHLVLTDLVMPGMNGMEVAARVTARSPEVRVLYMSGYADDDLGVEGLSAATLLSKPFTPSELLARVRRALADPAPERSPSPTRPGDT